MIVALVSLTWAAETPDWHAAQARQFLKRGWTADAEAQVAAGLALAPGHVELNSLCVELALPLGDVERALACAARGAAADGGDLDQRAHLAQTEAWLRANFAFLELSGPPGIERARPALESTGLQLDAALLEFTARAGERLRKGVALPARVALPAGDYTVQGHPVHLEPGRVAKLALPPEDFVAAAGRGRRLDLLVGVVGFSGFDVDNHRPGLYTELGFSFPVGPARFGFGATWEARSTTRSPQGDVFDPATLGGALHLGVPLDLGGAVVVTPGVLVRGAQMPGVALACDDATVPLACRPGVPDEGELSVSANAFGLTPAGELAVELNVGRVVLGLRGAVGHAFVLLPSPGQVATAAGIVAYQGDPAVLHAGVYSGAATVAVGL